MPTGYQIKNQKATYFLTFQVVFWVDLFSRDSYRKIIIESLKYCQKIKGLEVFAYVIMSNHMHIVARSSVGELSNTIRDFKKFTSKKIVEEIISGNESRREWMLNLFSSAAKRQNKKGSFQIWTHENHAVEVFSNSFIEQKVNYIHNNPVKNGLVFKPEDYVYSSAKYYTDGEGVLEVIPISSSYSILPWD